jgi:CRISPR/Cas system-associated exonuclease Cas4 (RecB family)
VILIRASNLERTALCCGSHWACEGIPYQSSPEADEGTLLHKACEVERWDEDVLTGEQISTVNRAIEIREKLMTRLFGQDKVLRQKEVFYKALRIGVSGKTDFLATSEKMALSVDYKFGRGDVEDAESNLQIRTYAVLAVLSGRIKPTVEDIYVAIIQPRVSNEPTLCRYTREDIDRAIKDIVSIREAAEPMGAPRTPSPQACRFCPASGTERCPESQVMIELVSRDIAPVPQKMALLLTAAKLAEPAIKRIRDAARAIISHGGEIPGWILEPNSDRAHVTDVMTGFNLLGEWITPQQYADSCRVTFGELEKQYREHHGCTWDEAKREVRKRLGPVIEMRSVAPSLKQDDRKVETDGKRE